MEPCGFLEKAFVALVMTPAGGKVKTHAGR